MARVRSTKKLPKPEAEDSQQSAGRNSFRLFKLPRSPYFHVRMMVEGRRRQFSTGEIMERAANTKARTILADIRSRGFNEAIALHSRRDDSVDEDPTIASLVALFTKVAATFEAPPSARSVRVYTNNLKLIAGYCGAERLSNLTASSIERGKRKYLAYSNEAKRDSNSARTTLASIIRNAAAVFSSQAISAYREEGLDISNPFVASRLRGVRIKAHSPLPQEILEKIWTQAPLLRDGNPQAPPPDPKVHRMRRFDFRLPHPDAYAILFLELGLGLRRNEADKAEWRWCTETKEGRRFMEVRATDVFTPKSKLSRTIPVAEDVWQALLTVGTVGERFIVPSPINDAKAVGKINYRCDSGHRALVEWLHLIGVDSVKPCHALRKEFGSYVATSFSLFHAQKLLGHSSPAVTAAYYASLTDLPDLQPSRMGQSS